MRFYYILPLLAAAVHAAGGLKSNAITAPIAGDVISSGKTYTIKWTNIAGTKVKLTLIDGPANQVSPVADIAVDQDNTGSYTWNVPSDLPASKTYAIRIQYNNNPDDWNYSDRFDFNSNAPPKVSSASSVSATASASTGVHTSATGTASTSGITYAPSTHVSISSYAASSTAVISSVSVRAGNSTVTTPTRPPSSTTSALLPSMAPDSSAPRSAGLGNIVVGAIVGLVAGALVMV
ncbi:hypothetical protein DRE_03013 [Drechslerella stenobrocha 248]|uniref:Yeast cell wall synthesis Kre9/Knh1-like N-terminal domain-containing protein n=1 Tax=Drechslerella stenobrocha 248 TaxID=1043628 RepID=W7I6I2_9PEZI|nr:hypothetical protein DRE_03013 [Drechslerella stenobrocha 248]